MKKNRTLLICLCSLMVSTLITGVYTFRNRSQKREPTQEEITATQIYKVDWDTIDLSEHLESTSAPSHKALILQLCTPAGDKLVDNIWYESFTSYPLTYYLYQCVEITDILLSQDGILSISYQALEDRQVILSYNDYGLTELVVYDQAADTMYHEIGETIEVWDNIGN